MGTVPDAMHVAAEAAGVAGVAGGAAASEATLGVTWACLGWAQDPHPQLAMITTTGYFDEPLKVPLEGWCPRVNPQELKSVLGKLTTEGSEWLTRRW